MQTDSFLNQLLVHLQDTDVGNYLTSDHEKTLLVFPQDCMGQENTDKQIMSIDCEMVVTDIGQQVCQVVIVDQDEKVVLNTRLRPKGNITDYLTHITGVKKGDLDIEKETLESLKPKILEIIHNRILVGHDLANDLKCLGVPHKNVIDTVALLPHNQGLPLKNKLKDLSLKYLNLPIQMDNHCPVEDAVAALRLVKQHVSSGRGVYKKVKGETKILTNAEDILKEIGLDYSRVEAFFLRGSRALGYATETSDYDYVLVYKTDAQSMGRLIKLYEVDIALYDHRSFDQELNLNNNIALFQLFFLDKQFQIINKLPFPTVNLHRLRESTAEEGYRSLRKAKYNLKEGNLMKALKCLFVCYRFYFVFYQYATKKDVNMRESLPFWEEMLKDVQTQRFETDQDCYHFHLKRVEKYKDSVRKDLPHTHYVDHEYSQLNHVAKAPTVQIDYSEFMKKLPVGQLNIINYLRKYGLVNLLAHYRVGHEKHAKYPNLVQLHYLLTANFEHRIPRECRGLIVDTNNNYEVVACPYFKFFDYCDKYSEIQNFKWESAQMYLKFDGSLCSLYYYEGWRVASSTKPDASGNYCFSRKETICVFKDEFWRIWHLEGYQLPEEEDRDKTFIFELLCKHHIIVVNHEKDSIVCHGCIRTKTFEDLDVAPLEHKYHWNVSKPLDGKVKSIEEVIALSQKLNPRQQEGFILKDCNNLRLKVKCSGYLRINYVNPINNNIIDKNYLLRLILDNEHQQFMAYCPEWKPQITKLQTRVNALLDTTLQFEHKYKQLSNKDLFMTAQKELSHELSAVVMLVRNYQLRRDTLLSKIEPKKLFKIMDADRHINPNPNPNPPLHPPPTETP